MTMIRRVVLLSTAVAGSIVLLALALSSQQPGEEGRRRDIHDHHATLVTIPNDEESSANLRRQLRFFDPDHSACGESEAQHLYAVHAVYGATTAAHPDYYKNQRTISVDRDFTPKNKAEAERVIRALSPVARQTGRAFRIRMPVILSYVGDHYADDFHEHLQPYSVINAAELLDVGVTAVEQNYWVRADGWRSVNQLPAHTVRTIGIGSGREEGIATLRYVANDENETSDEIVFSMDELLALDDEAVGQLAGEEGGYVDGEWVRLFTCRSVRDDEEVTFIA